MNDHSMWELLLGGLLVLLVLFWFAPGVKRSVEMSSEAKKDWPAVILPLGAVLLFVLFLLWII